MVDRNEPSGYIHISKKDLTEEAAEEHVQAVGDEEEGWVVSKDFDLFEMEVTKDDELYICGNVGNSFIAIYVDAEKVFQTIVKQIGDIVERRFKKLKSMTDSLEKMFEGD